MRLLNDDGGLLDSCFLAALLTLLNTRLPDVALHKNTLSINHSRLKKLNVHHLPICSTFYYLPGIA